MRYETITSTANKRIKQVAKLQTSASARRKEGLMVIEGFRGVREVPCELIESIYFTQDFLEKNQEKQWVEGVDTKNNDISLFWVSEEVMRYISDTQTSQGVLVVSRLPKYNVDLIGCKFDKILILESLQDPGNLGTIFRTAEGAGFDLIIMNKTTVDAYSPKVVRSTMGSVFRVPHIVVENLGEVIDQLKHADVSVYAAHLKGKKNYTSFDFKKPTAFMIGNEGNGLSEEISALATDYLLIPMEGSLESLNAAMAAGLLMYEVHRQREE